MRLEGQALLNACNEYFLYSEAQGGLVYRKWRRGLPKNCVGARAGNSHESGYKFIKIRGKLYAEHRLVWLMLTGEDPPFEIDHKNGINDDNRFDNLRPADRGQNCANRVGWSVSGFKGVSKSRRGKPWTAQITVNGKQKYLGQFETIEQAARAYDKAALTYKGDFAKLNFSKEDYIETSCSN